MRLIPNTESRSISERESQWLQSTWLTQSPLEHSWDDYYEIFKDVNSDNGNSGSSSDFLHLDSLVPEPSSTADQSSPNRGLQWVDETRNYVEAASSSEDAKVTPVDIDKVRQRLKKRRARPAEVPQAPTKDTKRVRNTLAARRYRERQRKDVEILDARLKQLEQQLLNSQVETKWWQMEAARWKAEAEKSNKED